jgi:hypothetical protein
LTKPPIGPAILGRESSLVTSASGAEALAKSPLFKTI